MPPTHLFETLHAGNVEAAELNQVLMEHFNSALQLSPDEIGYPGQLSQFALKLIYRKDRLADIVSGPALTGKDVETLERRIREELIASPVSRIGAEILFADRPVTAWFRYRDVLQILPVPPEAPRPSYLLGAQPFLLEFRFADSVNGSIRQLRRAIQGRQIELAIAGLVEGSIYSIGPIARKHWVLLPHVEAEPWRVSYCQEMYTFPGILFERDAFSSVEELPHMEGVEPKDYYTRWGVRPEPIRIPSTITELLDRFYALHPEDRDSFLRACFWFQQAGRTHSYSRSAAFTALISAVEALMPDEETTRHCPECNRPLGKGPTQRFADVIEKYAMPGDGLEAERKKFYTIRSKLSHGGTLLPSDYLSWSPGLTPKQAREWADFRKAWQLVDLVLVNWLTSPQS